MAVVNPQSESRDSSASRGFAPAEVDAFRQSFAEDGYVVFKDVVSKAKLADLRAQVIEEYERSKQAGSLFQGGGQISGHLNCFPGEPARFAYDVLKQSG